MAKKDLGDLRSSMDSVNASLIRLFDSRMDLSLAIGKIKKTEGMAVLDASREDEILSRVRDLSRYPSECSELFKELFRLSRKVQAEFDK